MILIFFLWQIKYLSFSQELKNDSTSGKKYSFDWQSNAKNEPFWKPIINMDIRQSFLKDAHVQIMGFQVGARNQGKYQFTLGYYWLTQNSQSQIRVRNRNRFVTINLEEDVKIEYFSACFNYMFLNTKYIELGFPTEIGFAQMKDKIVFPDGRILRDDAVNTIPIHLGLSTQIRATRWLGLKGAVGTRQIITNTRGVQIAQDFDGAYYSYGAVLYLNNIYKDVFKKK
jgi:hypothetical protein